MSHTIRIVAATLALGWLGCKPPKEPEEPAPVRLTIALALRVQSQVPASAEARCVEEVVASLRHHGVAVDDSGELVDAELIYFEDHAETVAQPAHFEPLDPNWPLSPPPRASIMSAELVARPHRRPTIRVAAGGATSCTSVGDRLARALLTKR